MLLDNWGIFASRLFFCMCYNLLRHRENFMLDFLFTQKQPEISKDKELNEIYENLKKVYSFDNIEQERKDFLSIPNSITFIINNYFII